MLLNERASIGWRPLILTEMPPPEPGPNEVRVRVRVCGVCRTDLHIVEGDIRDGALPIIPGHQVVGVVDKLGSAAGRFKPDQRVGIAWLRHTCGLCEFCRSGSENLCALSRYSGYHAHGGYAEFAVVDEAYAYPIPPALSDEQAAPLLCAGIIGYRAFKRCALKRAQRLALYGFGSSAHITLQVARSMGIEVYVASRGKRHQQLAHELGAQWVGEGNEALPRPVHAAIVFAPAGELVPAALRALEKGGAVVCAGIHMSDIPAMDYASCLFHEKRLLSVEANTRTDGAELFELAGRYGIRSRTVLYRLEEANEALRALKEDGIQGTALLEVG